MKTVELYYNVKFKVADDFLNKMKLLNIESLSKFIEDNLEQLFYLKNRFMIILGNLYMNNNSIEANLTFERSLNNVDFSNIINNIISRCILTLKNNNITLRDEKLITRKKQKNTKIIDDLQHLYNIFPKNSDSFSNSLNNKIEYRYEICQSCSLNMIIDNISSELKCNNCGAIRELIGTSFEDTNIFAQDGQKSKTGTFNPNRHFQFWWMHILAEEPEEELGDKEDKDNLYGEKTIEGLKNIIRRDRKILRTLTVYDIRLMLREIGRSDLNKNVPLLLQKLTGVGPPQISDEITAKVENLFTKAIEICENVRKTNRTNRNYYPYYIYKILDAILDKNDERRKIFYYIYIQSKETVESDDADWEQICKILDEIEYVPTDRNMYLKYRPL
jgi:hypothetical protein